ncbi:hypothetical protein [Sporocytophaga myxococcoides]|uniref:hypothetical protein n=1 Tax=Sporocytophaga myxococcoides TaxID=153721 RepID=UPI0012DFF5B4|nr:hypothetical protein [Sporocytophaga myxococcoides]
MTEDLNLAVICVFLFGVSGAVCYFLNKPIYKTLLHLWAVGQTVVFVIPYLNWNVSFIYSSVFSLFFKLKSGGEIKLGINLVGMFYIFANHYFNHLRYMFGLVGTKVTLSPIKPMANLKDLNHLLPLQGEILKRVKIDKDDNWMLVQIHDSDRNSTTLNYFAVRSTDNETFKPGSNKLIRVLRVKDISKIEENEFKKDDFEYLGVAKGK